MLFIVIFFSAFTFTKNYHSLKGYIRSLFSESAIQSGHRTWADGLQMLGRYVRSYLLIYFLTFLQTFVLFLILDIDYPLIWSALVGLSDIIPILGPGTIYIPMAIVRAIAGDWRVALFLMLGWLFITVVRQFVESKVVADSINIHPLFMLAVLFIAFQAGSFGLLIYLTFLLVFYNLLKHSGMLRPLFAVGEASPKAKRAPGKWRKKRRARKDPQGTTLFENLLSGPPEPTGTDAPDPEHGMNGNGETDTSAGGQPDMTHRSHDEPASAGAADHARGDEKPE